jgi:hypothetical protein
MISSSSSSPPTPPSSHSQLPFLPLEERVTVKLVKGFEDLTSLGTFTVLDDRKTHRHDDGVLVLKSGETYTLFIAVSPIGNYTSYEWGPLMRRTPQLVVDARDHIRTRGRSADYSFKTGECEALVFEFDTDLRTIGGVSLYRATIDAQLFAHRRESSGRESRFSTPNVPRWHEEELLHVTNSENTESAVQKLMLLQHALAARFLKQQAIPGLFVHYIDGKPVYTPEPVVNNVSARSSSPMWRTPDRIGTSQLYNGLRGQKVFGVDRMAAVCRNLNHQHGTGGYAARYAA